ncbi:MAG: DUF1836 domain-containing protein [Clostridia bacterium]|nr:DUF1836 domain-containing protein [Clostridia bacterium]
MNLIADGSMIPGTILKREDMGNATGLEFLNKIFYISDGIMMSQIRGISGIDTSTLQNWVKRHWVESAKLKKYNIDQVAHILIINMLRSCMQLDHIAFLIRYINGSVDSREDDIIRDSVLYDYICRIIDRMTETDCVPDHKVKQYIEEVISDYEEKIGGARRRLVKALEVIIVAYYASLMKQRADRMLAALAQ